MTGHPGRRKPPIWGNKSAFRVRYGSSMIFEAIATEGWFAGPVMDLLAPVSLTIMMGVEAHLDENTTAPLWAPNPGGYTFIACNNP
jgi:hypothetical protein